MGGWQEGDLWQDDDGEGEAGEEDRQGLPVGCPEEEHLSRERGVLSGPENLCPWRLPLLVGALRKRQRQGSGERHHGGTCTLVGIADAGTCRLFVYLRDAPRK